jgi:hypothetical protein
VSSLINAPKVQPLNWHCLDLHRLLPIRRPSSPHSLRGLEQLAIATQVVFIATKILSFLSIHNNRHIPAFAVAVWWSWPARFCSCERLAGINVTIDVSP